MQLGLFSVTFLILLVLKLVGAATISWWIVFSPLIFGFIITVIAILIAVSSRAGY